VDFRIHFIKANGTGKPKVFKLKQLTLASGETIKLRKTVSLQEMTHANTILVRIAWRW
jgi:hypothetical protein